MSDDLVWDSADDPGWDIYDELWPHIRHLEHEAGEGRLPRCAFEGRCEDCPVASGKTCPISTDNDFISLLLYYSATDSGLSQLTAQSSQSWTQTVREQRLNLIARVLQRNKLAMHWELVAKIVKEEEPVLFPSPRSVLATLRGNPERFSMESPGSYFLNAD